jgi:hypothetical protein
MMIERDIGHVDPTTIEAEAVNSSAETKAKQEFPTNPEDRFEALFAAIGNSEAKMLTLLSLSRQLITKGDLHGEFVRLSEGVWRTDNKLQANYCQYTLAPIGLVAEELFVRVGTQDKVVGFKITEAGYEYGVPIAAYLLSKSHELPHPFLTIFGPTSTSGGKTRSVTNRANILEYLDSQDEPVREVDVVNVLGIDQGKTGARLTHLSNLGLIEYSSVNSEERGKIKYFLEKEAKRESVAIVSAYTNLTQEVADIVFETGEVDSNSVYERLRGQHPNAKEKGLRQQLSKILSGLEKQGILRRGIFKAGEVQSQARITEEGRRVVRDIIEPVKRALSGDEELLEAWRHIRWQQYAKEAVARYRESSGYANSRSREEKTGEVLALILQNPGIRPGEIIEQLGYFPMKMLHDLLEAGRISREIEGKAARYTVVEGTVN